MNNKDKVLKRIKKAEDLDYVNTNRTKIYHSPENRLIIGKKRITFFGVEVPLSNDEISELYKFARLKCLENQDTKEHKILRDL